jgi:hypothetical protein
MRELPDQQPYALGRDDFLLQIKIALAQCIIGKGRGKERPMSPITSDRQPFDLKPVLGPFQPALKYARDALPAA